MPLARFFHRQALWLLLLAGPGWAAAEELTAEGRIAATQLGGLVEQSGFRYRKLTEAAWVVFDKNPAGQELPVICASTPEIVVIGIVAATKQKMQLNEEALRWLLKMNHEYDLVKLVFDGDDDLTVRLDLPLKAADLAAFKSAVHQCIKVRDSIRERLKSNLLP